MPVAVAADGDLPEEDPAPTEEVSAPVEEETAPAEEVGELPAVSAEKEETADDAADQVDADDAEPFEEPTEDVSSADDSDAGDESAENTDEETADETDPETEEILSVDGDEEEPLEPPAALTSGSCGDDVIWSLSDGVLTISGNGEIEWDDWYDISGAINSVIIGEGVTSVCDWCFQNCSNLTEITIPESVTVIGYYAFNECVSLSKVNYPGAPEAWYEIDIDTGNAPLWNAMGLVQPTAGKCGTDARWKLEEGVLTIFGSDSVESYPWRNYAESITSIVIEDGITSIPEWAFDDCYSVVSVVIPASMETIGAYAFSSCYNLSSVTYKGSGADDWYKMTIEGGNTYLWNASGYPIRAAGEFTMENGDSFQWTLEDGVLTVTGEGELDLSNNYSGYCWGSYQSEVTSVKVGEGITSVVAAFGNMRNLKSVDLPEGLTTIGDYAFQGCSRLASIDLPDSLTTIGDYAFRECYQLTSIDLPDGLSTIGDYAFRACWNLSTLSLPLSVRTIGEYAFSNYLKTVNYPGKEDDWNAIAIGEGNSQLWLASGFQPEAEGAIGDLTWKLSKGILTISGSGSMEGETYEPWSSYATLIGEIVIEDGVTSICDYAFSGCVNAKTLSIPASVTSIGDSVCSRCESMTATYAGTEQEWFENVTVGMNNYDLWNSLKDIPFRVEGTCGDSATWVFDEGTLEIKGTGEVTSYDWRSYIGEGNTKLLIIAEGITSIPDYAFSEYYRMASAELPLSLTAIGTSAFGYCQNLSKIVYAGSQTDWDKIAIGANNAYLLRAVMASGYTIKGKIGDTVSYSIYSGTLTISGEGKASIDFDGPNNPWYGYDGYIDKIVVEEGITELSAFMFQQLYYVTTLELPHSLQVIGPRVMGYEGGADWKLTVRYAGNEADWNKITVRYGNAILWNSLGYAANKSGTAGDADWTLKDGVLTVSGGDIPSYAYYMNSGYYDDGDDSGYAPWCDYAEFITDIVLGDGITSIGTYAFAGLSQVTYVKVPEGVKTIADGAFDYTYALASVWLPKSLESIGKYSLYYPAVVYYSGSEEDWGKVTITTSSELAAHPKRDNWLETAKFIYNYDGGLITVATGKAGDNVEWAYDSSGLLSFTGNGEMYDELMYDELSWYRFNNAYTSVSIEDGITTLPRLAFASSKLTEAELPDSITTVVYGLFMYSKLQSVELPEKLVSIEERAFYNTPLEEIELPNTVTSIGKYAFAATDLEKVDLPDGLTSIGSHAFEATNISEVSIPDGVTEIAYATFRNCQDLSSVTIPTSVTSIDNAAFFGTAGGDVYYGGTAEDWEAVNIRGGSGLDNYTIHFTGLDYAVQLDNNTNGAVAVSLGQDDADAIIGDEDSTFKPAAGKKLDDSEPVEVEVVVKPVQQPDSADKAAIEQSAGETGEVLQYFELSVDVYQGDELIGSITETPEVIRFTIILTKEQANSIGVGKVFVVRIHDNKAETLPAEYNPANRTLTFVSDKFSTYAIAVDGEKEQVLVGDINGDGVVNSGDLIRMLKYLTGKADDRTKSRIIDVGDFDHSTEVKANDLIRLLKYINGQLKTLY